MPQLGKRYAGEGPVPRALFNRRHPPRRAPTLRVRYLPLNNALGTGPPPLPYLSHQLVLVAGSFQVQEGEGLSSYEDEDRTRS